DLLEVEQLAVLPERLGGAAEAAGLLLGELHLGDAEDAGAAEAGGEAEEDLVVLGDAVEAGGEDGDGVDAVLVAEEGGGEAGDGVADGPGGVALEADHLVRAVHHRSPDSLQGLLVEALVALPQRLEHRHPGHAHARPYRHRAVPVLSHHEASHPWK
ncbi:Os02g0105300, partial [Oryza sativa Japonica Group]